MLSSGSSLEAGWPVVKPGNTKLVRTFTYARTVCDGGTASSGPGRRTPRRECADGSQREPAKTIAASQRRSGPTTMRNAARATTATQTCMSR